MIYQPALKAILSQLPSSASQGKMVARRTSVKRMFTRHDQHYSSTNDKNVSGHPHSRNKDQGLVQAPIDSARDEIALRVQLARGKKQGKEGQVAGIKAGITPKNRGQLVPHLDSNLYYSSPPFHPTSTAVCHSSEVFQTPLATQILHPTSKCSPSRTQRSSEALKRGVPTKP